MILRYLNRSHRPREIAPRRHPIPQLVEVVHLVGREIVDAHSVHARRSTVRSDLLPRLEHETLPNFKRLQLLLRSICRLLPRRVDLQTTVNCPAPSLRPHYRALTATTGRSAPVPRIGTLALAVFAACGSPSRGQLPRPSLRGDRFSCSMPAPATSSRHLYTGHRRGHIQAAPRLRAHRRRAFVPGPPTDPSFDAVSSGSHMFVFSSHTRPAHSETSPAALTTPALDRRSLRWFGISACTATPEDLPPSLAQHGSCRRSSTSSSLPFRTHGEWREGTSPSRSLRTVRDSLPSYGSHSPAFFCFGPSVGSSPEGLTSKRP